MTRSVAIHEPDPVGGDTEVAPYVMRFINRCRIEHGIPDPRPPIADLRWLAIDIVVELCRSLFPDDLDVFERIKKDVQDRIDAGEKKLMTNNGRNAVMDAYQEAIDLIMYIYQHMLEVGDV